MSRTNSWMNVSALWILAAAGTILGTSAIASAQSAPAKVQKRVQIVQDGGSPQVRVQVEDDDDDAPKARRQIELRRSGGEGKAERGEKRVIVLDGKGQGGCCGDGCCCCGGGDKDDGAEPSRFGDKGKEIRQRKVIRLGGGQGGAGSWSVGGDGPEPHVMVFGPGAEGKGFAFGEGGSGTNVFRFQTPEGAREQAVEIRGRVERQAQEERARARELAAQARGRAAEIRSRVERQVEEERAHGLGGAHGQGEAHGQGGAHISGKVIIVGPDGKEHVHTFGDDGAREGSFKVWRGDGEGGAKNFMWRAEPEGKGGDDGDRGPEIRLRKLERGPGGGGGTFFKSGNVHGQIVIVGPDGKEQAFDFGDENSGLQVRGLSLPKLEMRDGLPRDGHLFFMPGDDGRAGPGHGTWILDKGHSSTCEAM